MTCGFLTASSAVAWKCVGDIHIHGIPSVTTRMDTLLGPTVRPMMEIRNLKRADGRISYPPALPSSTLCPCPLQFGCAPLWLPIVVQGCYSQDCSRPPSFGWEKSGTVSSCVLHRQNGMTQMRGAACEFPRCKANPSCALLVSGERLGSPVASRE